MRVSWAAPTYAASIVAANVLTERMGLVPVGFGMVATAGTYAAATRLVKRLGGTDAPAILAMLGIAS